MRGGVRRHCSRGGIGHAETCGDSAVAVYQRHRRLFCRGAEVQTVLQTIAIPQPFLDKVVNAPRYAGVQAVKIPVVGQRQFPKVFQTVDISPFVGHGDRCPCCASRAGRRCFRRGAEADFHGPDCLSDQRDSPVLLNTVIDVLVAQVERVSQVPSWRRQSSSRSCTFCATRCG